MMPVRRLSLTDFKCRISRGAREKSLKAALDGEEVMKKWSETAWAKKLARQGGPRQDDGFRQVQAHGGEEEARGRGQEGDQEVQEVSARRAGADPRRLDPFLHT